MQDLRSLLIFALFSVRSSAILRRTRPNAKCIIARSWVMDNQLRLRRQICVSPIMEKLNNSAFFLA